MGSCQSSTSAAATAVANTPAAAIIKPTLAVGQKVEPTVLSARTVETTTTTACCSTTPHHHPMQHGTMPEDDEDDDDDSGCFSCGGEGDDSHQLDDEEEGNKKEATTTTANAGKPQTAVSTTVDVKDGDNNNHHHHHQEEAPCTEGSGGMGMKRKSSRCGLDTMLAERRHSGTFLENVVPIETPESPTAVPIRSVYRGVDHGDVLGEGIAGIVRSVQHRKTNMQYAVKVLNLNRLLAQPTPARQEESKAALLNEIRIMAQLDHPHIARLQEVYEDDDDCLYLVQEVCWGGDLLDWMDELDAGHFDEATARRLVQQMLSALRYLHSKGIVHRDLKMENFLLSATATTQNNSADAAPQVKMIDFGLAKFFVRHHDKHCENNEMLHEQVGTAYTVAPEVIAGNYDERCDLWGMGVLTYMLLCGEAPFGYEAPTPQDMRAMRDRIVANNWSFDHERPDVWATVSDDAKDFIQSLLVLDPTQRPTAAQAQQHPWLRQDVPPGTSPPTPALPTATAVPRMPLQRTVSPPIVQALRDFKDLDINKRLMFEVVSFTLMQDQIAHIQAEFEKLDTDGLGELSLDNMRLAFVGTTAAADAGVGGGPTPRLQQPNNQNNNDDDDDIVQAVFESLKVGKAETRVHWHEFVAACLPTCRVHEGNLRIAFDRLDQDHDGYITYDEVVQMIARDGDEAALRQAWMDSIEEYHCAQSQFDFEDFCRLIHSYA